MDPYSKVKPWVLFETSELSNSSDSFPNFLNRMRFEISPLTCILYFSPLSKPKTQFFKSSYLCPLLESWILQSIWNWHVWLQNTSFYIRCYRTSISRYVCVLFSYPRIFWRWQLSCLHFGRPTEFRFRNLVNFSRDKNTFHDVFRVTKIAQITLFCFNFHGNWFLLRWDSSSPLIRH